MSSGRRVGRTTRFAVLAAMVAAAFAACADGQRFETTLRAPDGSYELPVTLTDQTGLVQGIDLGGVEDAEYGLDPTIIPSSDRSMIGISWLGGACTDRVELSFARTETGYSLRLKGDAPLFASCPAIGLSRAVWVRLSEPIDASTVVAYGREP